MYEPGMWHPWGMGVGMIVMVLLWIFAVIGIVYSIRWVLGYTATRQGERAPESALDILKKRYARGEIGKEDYEEKKKDLR